MNNATRERIQPKEKPMNTQKKHILPVMAIVGRPNVGKSTLFNRLSRVKKAIVIDEPGATRDRNYGEAEWNGRTFTVIDTGGFEPVSRERMLIQMREQTTLAIEEADVIVFLLDGHEGLTPSDEDIAAILRRTRKSVFYAVNKIDGPRHEAQVYDFYRLGADVIFPISAQHGRGIGDLLDSAVDALPVIDVPEHDDSAIRIALIGRPNTGKSSLVNRILGYERTIVNDTPGTTRDAIDTPFSYENQSYVLIDTAGIRRKSRVSLTLEKYCVLEAITVLTRCDIALIMIDAVDGVTEQDTKIAGLAYERGVPSLFVLNKWDLITKDTMTIGEYVRQLKDKLKFFDFAPIISISALTGQRVTKIFDFVTELHRQSTTRVPTSQLNAVMHEITSAHPPPRYRNRPHSIVFSTQVGIAPPTFVFFVKEPQAIHFSYERYLANRIRENLPFDSVPIRLIFRRKKRDKK